MGGSSKPRSGPLLIVIENSIIEKKAVIKERKVIFDFLTVVSIKRAHSLTVRSY